MIVWGRVCASMCIPRMWAIKRDHRVPLGKREPHGLGLVMVFLSPSALVSVATTDTTTADYPAD